MAEAPPPPADHLDHLDWLDEQRRRMRALVRHAQNPGGGLGWLSDDGGLDPD